MLVQGCRCPSPLLAVGASRPEDPAASSSHAAAGDDPLTARMQSANPLVPPATAAGEPQPGATARPGPVPSAASEFEVAAGGQYYDLDAMEDEFWDYERQVDLEGFTGPAAARHIVWNWVYLA